jgi:UDP-N-acetylmuramyl pentapeptide phosphotransferase/UDP-N-acetylglucosamine-1-phosphate transferase
MRCGRRAPIFETQDRAPLSTTERPVVEQKGKLGIRIATFFKNAGPKIKDAFKSDTAKKIGKIALITFAVLFTIACIAAVPFTAGLSLLVPLAILSAAVSIFFLHQAYQLSKAARTLTYDGLATL